MGPLGRLTRYLREVNGRPFAYHAWDCFQFSNEGWRAMHGHGWGDDLAGKYTDKNGLYLRAANLRGVYGFDTVEDALDARMQRLPFPVRGALVLAELGGAAQKITGCSIGFCTGTRGAFVGRKGVETVTIDKTFGGWI